ncbi:hypothetical protein ACK3Z7_18930 [Aeromonas caviae]
METQGVELEASGYLSQNWMVMTGYTFTGIEEKAGDHNPKFDTIPALLLKSGNYLSSR